MINSGEVSGVVEALEQPIQGDVTPTQSLTGEVQHGSGVGGVRDVLVNEESVVDNNKIAHIDLTPYAEIENVYDKDAIDTALGQIDEALEGKADVDDIPTELADLNGDETHRVVTDEQISAWNDKADTEDIPTALSQLTNDDNYVQDANYVHTDNNFTNADKQAIGSIPTKTSDLTNDSDFVADANYVHTDNNYTDADKTALGNKSTVGWNQIKQSGEKIAEITIDGQKTDVYASNGGGGGGSVNDAYKSVKVGNTTITASGEDTIEFEAGSNVTLTPNAQNKKITISASGGGSGDVTDVKVNDVSVVDGQGVANIDLSGYAETTDIPTDLSDLQDDTDHRLVTDTEKSTWNGKSDFSGSYNDLTDKPTIPDAQIQSDWEQSDDTKVDFIKNKPTIPSAQVNSDWNASSGVAQILNKPTLGTASALDVATSGDASTTQVVKGDDSRLTDSRNAADVYSWAKASTKPSYTASEVGAIPSTDKGANGGVAELDSNGKVPSSQLPSYVDDVLEYASVSAFPATGESGKIYIALDTNKTYRWGGSEYVEISESLALGETSSTAYRGDRGKTAYDHSQLTSGNPHNVSKSDVGLGNVDNTSDSTKKTNFTGSIASGNTGFTTGGDVYTALQGKVNTETGKGLSTNDYTTAEKDKLSGIESGAEVNQNAFGTINISGASSIVADSESDAFMIIPSGRINIGVSGKGMTITTSATKTEASETNGNIKINSVETPVYRNYANNTVLSTDKTPYLNRPCLTPTGFSSYVREKLIGCSVAWNNLCNGSSVTVPSGHKYLLKKSGVLSLGESTGSAITGLTSGTDVVTDLTLAFGSQVADALYAMEQS